MTETLPTWQFISAELREGGNLVLENEFIARTFTLSAAVDRPKPQPGPGITPYSQHDPRWANEVYAGGATFADAGCYTTCVAMVASLAGYADTPPECAAKLRAAGCYDGALLTRPQNIPAAYPRLEYGGWWNWHDEPAELDVFFDALGEGPVIIEVDFRPSTRKFDQHFVIAERWDEEAADVAIIDPWDGQRARLLDRYMLVWYALGRTTRRLESAICGMRVLRQERQ